MRKDGALEPLYSPRDTKILVQGPGNGKKRRPHTATASRFTLQSSFNYSALRFVGINHTNFGNH